MNPKPIDWLAVAAYSRAESAPAPARGFADTLPMPTAPMATRLDRLDDGHDDGGEWTAAPLPSLTRLLSRVIGHARAGLQHLINGA